KKREGWGGTGVGEAGGAGGIGRGEPAPQRRGACLSSRPSGAARALERELAAPLAIARACTVDRVDGTQHFLSSGASAGSSRRRPASLRGPGAGTDVPVVSALQGGVRTARGDGSPVP